MVIKCSCFRKKSRRQFLSSLLFLILLDSMLHVISAQSNLMVTNALLYTAIKQIEINIEKADLRIFKYENEISKCDKTISNSEKIKQLAIEKGNNEAQKIANDALLKAKDAKDKYKRLLESARKLKQQSEKILGSLKQQQYISNPKLNTALSLNFSGNVSIQKNNGEQFQLNESNPSYIEEGDLITTSSNSKIDLQFLDGRGNMLMGENSQLKFNKSDSVNVIDFIQGNVKIIVEKKDAFEKRMKEMYENLKQEVGSLPEDYDQFIKKQRARVQRKLEIRNRNGGGGAVRGTELVVNSSDELGTEILVLEGSVEMFSKDRVQIVKLESGQKGIIKSNGQLSDPINIDLKSIYKWWEENE